MLKDEEWSDYPAQRVNGRTNRGNLIDVTHKVTRDFKDDATILA